MQIIVGPTVFAVALLSTLGRLSTQQPEVTAEERVLLDSWLRNLASIDTPEVPAIRPPDWVVEGRKPSRGVIVRALGETVFAIRIGDDWDGIDPRTVDLGCRAADPTSWLSGDRLRPVAAADGYWFCRLVAGIPGRPQVGDEVSVRLVSKLVLPEDDELVVAMRNAAGIEMQPSAEVRQTRSFAGRIVWSDRIMVAVRPDPTESDDLDLRDAELAASFLYDHPTAYAPLRGDVVLRPVARFDGGWLCRIAGGHGQLSLHGLDPGVRVTHIAANPSALRFSDALREARSLAGSATAVAIGSPQLGVIILQDGPMLMVRLLPPPSDAPDDPPAEPATVWTIHPYQAPDAQREPACRIQPLVPHRSQRNVWLCGITAGPPPPALMLIEVAARR